MHSWRRNVQLFEMVGRPKTLGFQADMAHVMLFTMGYNAPEDKIEGVLELAMMRRMTRKEGGAASVDHRFSRGAERWDGEGVGVAR